MEYRRFVFLSLVLLVNVVAAQTAEPVVGVTAANAAPPNMALIPGGSFQMGDNFAGALPVHSVYVSDFYLDKFEVTKDLWDTVCGYAVSHGYDLSSGTGIGEGVGPKHPVHTVRWFNAVKWCNARSEREGRTPVYYTDTEKTKVYRTGYVDVTEDMVKWTANGYRLPTEAEWEKAARGGLARNHYPWSSTNKDYYADISGGKANYYDSGDPFSGKLPQTTPVGYYDGKQTPAGPDMANGYGLYDMAGNVWEWCWDFYGPYSADAQRDPRGHRAVAPHPGAAEGYAYEGNWRVFRGGGWRHDASYSRVSYRGYYKPSLRYYYVGFRCAMTASQGDLGQGEVGVAAPSSSTAVRQ